MEGSKCGFCARPLAPGALRYVLMWKLYADYDGIIDIEDGNRLERALRDVRKGSPDRIEDQVYMERRHILCPSCREEILETLGSMEHMGPEADADGEEEKDERNLH